MPVDGEGGRACCNEVRWKGADEGGGGGGAGGLSQIDTTCRVVGVVASPGHVAAGQQPLSAADTVYVLAKLLITRLGGSSKTTQVRRRRSSASPVARCFFATNERSRRRRQRGQAVESWSHRRPGVERTSGSRSSQLVPRSALKRLWLHYRDQWRNYVYVILRFRCA